MNRCEICGTTLPNHDDEICNACAKEVQAYFDEMREEALAEALAYAEWAESECQDCGLPNPACDCEVKVSGD